jgi:hypothetical protein
MKKVAIVGLGWLGLVKKGLPIAAIFARLNLTNEYSFIYGIFYDTRSG